MPGLGFELTSHSLKRPMSAKYTYLYSRDQNLVDFTGIEIELDDFEEQHQQRQTPQKVFNFRRTTNRVPMPMSYMLKCFPKYTLIAMALTAGVATPTIASDALYNGVACSTIESAKSMARIAVDMSTNSDRITAGNVNIDIPAGCLVKTNVPESFIEDALISRTSHTGEEGIVLLPSGGYFIYIEELNLRRNSASRIVFPRVSQCRNQSAPRT